MAESHSLIFLATFLVYCFVRIDAQLMCWSCSSDLDIRCHDHFNTTKFDRYYQQQNQYQGNYNQGGGGYPQQNYRDNRNGNGYNQPGGYNQAYNNNPYQSRPTSPYIKPCSFTSYGDKKSVCMKKVQTSNDGRTVTIRDCATIPMHQSVGTCPTEQNSYIRVDFCEYCETDGCNSANGLEFNKILGLISLLLATLVLKH